jgi:hypothetical protein
LGEFEMTTSTDQRPNPLAVIIVYGRTGGDGIPQASWFKAEDKQAAKAAADPLKLSVIDLKTEQERALTAGVHEGVLKGSGRMIIGSVEPDVFRRIEDYVRKAASPNPGTKLGEVAVGPPPAARPIETAIGSGASEAKAATAAAPAAAAPAQNPHPSPTNPWDALRVGATVLAAYWDANNEIEGWWPAIIARADIDKFALKWRDSTEYPLGKVERKHIAILHPEFLASGK